MCLAFASLALVASVCLGDEGDYTAARSDGPIPIMGGNPLSNVPEYCWWYGCSPTSGGMMVAFWDSVAGRANLYKKGDAQVWGGSGASGTKRIVASTQHIVAGSDNGHTYGDWHNSASYPNHEANPDCLADFMKTVDGGSWSSDIRSGLEAYCRWDDTSAYDIKDGYADFNATLDQVPFYGGTYCYQDLKDEIDAGRPVLLDVVTIPYQDADAIGHSVVAYGYQDNMFWLKDPATSAAVTVGGYAVRDTWCTGDSQQSEWVDPDFNLVPAVIDGQGVEWWPFLEFKGSSWVYTNPPPLGPYDWMVVEGIELTPEPMSLSLLGFMGLVLLRRRRRA